MLWRDFAPFVLPFVVGCPVPVLEHHARLTAIDWCRKTLCLQRDLDPVPASGTSSVTTIQPPAGHAVVRVLEVTVDGREWTLVGDRHGRAFERTGHPGEFAYTPANHTLHVLPLQAAGASIVARAALMPTLLGTSTELEDDVASEYADAIALGVIAAIKRLPGEDFTDPAGAIDNQARYEARRASVAAKVARGLSANKTRTPLKTF